MKNKKTRLIPIIVCLGFMTGCNAPTIHTNHNTKMDKSTCLQNNGQWGQHYDTYKDGSEEYYFACSCPKNISGESNIIFEGSTEGCDSPRN